METVQLFISIDKRGLNDEWNEEITDALKTLFSAKQVMVIEGNEGSCAQISLSYKTEELSFDRIENIVIDSGATIIDINIHFPSGITGIADPYGASAISIPIEENMKKIEGVLGAAISERGELGVLLDANTKNKQAVIDEILETYSSIRPGKDMG